MKKFIITILIILIFPLIGQTETLIESPQDANIISGPESANLSWKNPNNPNFAQTIIFRAPFSIENYYTYEAVAPLFDEVYRGVGQGFADNGLVPILPYYYILFARDKSGNYSKAVILERKVLTEERTNETQDTASQNDTNTSKSSLSGASSQVVNDVSLSEAGMVYNFNQPLDLEPNDETQRLALFIIVRSPKALNENDKNSISYFIHSGTPTTIILGSGERAGVLNSYLSVYSKLPRNVLEWQDVIKIANGRWPTERSIDSEKRASDEFFSTIYERAPDMNNPNDNAAVTVIAYGLRPSERNMGSEKKAIEIFRDIFKKSPNIATDWDIVRAIAYSGATR